jgi:hypothetical protein
MTSIHVDLYPGVRVRRGQQNITVAEYTLVGDVTLDDQKHPWGTLTIGYVLRQERVELTQVALVPSESEGPIAMPPDLLRLLHRRNLMVGVNRDISTYRRASARLAGPTEARPAHRPPLTSDVWASRAEAIVECQDAIVEQIRDVKELDLPDDPPKAYDILREWWTDDGFDGEPSNEQIANRMRATRQRGFVKGDWRDRSVAFGPAYLDLLQDGQE